MAGSNERARRRARDRHEQLRQVRLERQQRNRKRAGIGLAVLCVIGLVVGLSVAFIGGGTPKAAPKPKASATASSTATATATASAAAVSEPAHHCTYTSTATSGSKPSLPTSSPDYSAAYTASINTNLGPIKINLLNSKATCTVNSFVHLAETNFFNKTQCWRVDNSQGIYMLQCGDPTAGANDKLSCSSATLGTGGPGYQFDDENLTGATYNAGTVAMANGGANTNGSQFFLVFKNTTLGPDYTPFGTITSGLNILQNDAKAGTTCTISAGGGPPKEKVIIDSVTIKKN